MYQQLVYDEIQGIVTQGSQLRVAYWKENALFTWQWWLLLLFIAITAAVWWKLVNKNRLIEISCYALMGCIPAIFFDATAISMGWYSYPIQIQPYFPGPVLGITVPALIYSLAYQYYPRWRDFYIALLIISAFFSFIGQPILTWIGVFKLYKYNYIYSFLMFIAIAGFSKWFVDVLKSFRAVH